MKQKYDIENGKCVFLPEGRVVQEDAPSPGQTGFTEPAHNEKYLRHVFTDNCPVLDAGRSSTVYQLDSETIVKKYDDHVPIAKIRKEMEQARKAFILGIPTPIPFELVWADDSYGLIFERIAPADTIGKTITEHRERFYELTRKYTDLLKKIHQTRIEKKDNFPAAKSIWAKWVEGMVPYYTEAEIGFLQEMVHGIPEHNTMVHCDFHENNVLVLGNKLVLIDMADIGYGHPIFDLAGGAFRAHASLIPGRQAHHGFSAKEMQLFWETVLRYYIKTEDSEKLNKIHDMCHAFGLVRSALFPMKHVHISDELRQLHINDARMNLFTRKDWALEQLRSLGGETGDGPLSPLFNDEKETEVRPPSPAEKYLNDYQAGGSCRGPQKEHR